MNLGAWVLFAPTQLVNRAGYIGLIVYALGCSVTLFLPSFFAPIIQSQTNNECFSLSNYAEQRFGKIGQYFITLICIYSMGVGITAEYTTIGDLFEQIVGGSRLFIVLFIGIQTSIYSSIGGISVSIQTDQIQGYFMTMIFIVVSLYVWITQPINFNKPLPANLGATEQGYNQIFSLSIALMSSVIFSETFWERSWAAKDQYTLNKATIVASISVFLVVLSFGFFGFLVIWNSNTSFDENDNLILFHAFNNKLILTIVILLACIINQSAVDSYQLGLATSISSCFLKNHPLWMSQILVFFINIPFVIVSLQNYGVFNLFLSANMITASAMGPLLLGLNKNLQQYYGQQEMIISSICGLLAPTLFYIIKLRSFKNGINYVFFDQYDNFAFLLAIFFSLISVVFCSYLNSKYVKQNRLLNNRENLNESF